MKKLLFLSPLLALAACQGAPEANAVNQADEQKQLDAPVKDVETLPPDETTVVPERDGSLTVAHGTAATGIPESMQGRWALVPADCTSTRGDA